MSKRETDAVANVLTDPENENRSAEEVADLVIQCLDDLRSRTHRLAVVGQIRFEAQEDPHTVVLGPFSARGLLDTREKFLKATEGGSAARQAGQDLAWDTKTGKGRGRFMLAPAFLRPRDAWNFFRPDEEPASRRFAWIAKSIVRWEAGGYGPTCICGLRAAGPCPRHP